MCENLLDLLLQEWVSSMFLYYFQREVFIVYLSAHVAHFSQFFPRFSKLTIVSVQPVREECVVFCLLKRSPLTAVIEGGAGGALSLARNDHTLKYNNVLFLLQITYSHICLL